MSRRKPDRRDLIIAILILVILAVLILSIEPKPEPEKQPANISKIVKFIS